MVACLGVYTGINIAEQKQHLLDLVHQNALGTTDLIKNSIHYSMLINRKDDISQIFNNFGSLKQFEAIRIYDKKGRIIYSTREGEIDGHVSIGSEACQVCHRQEEPKKALESEDRLRITKTDEGNRVLALINPIENEPACSGQDCHVSPDKRAILGVLDVQMSLEEVYVDIGHNQKSAAVGAGILVLVVLAVVAFLIWSQIRLPVRSLTEGTKAIAAGDLDYIIPIRRMDELGQLASSFNMMVSELKKARSEITKWSDTLQEKVDEKTEELQKIQSHLVHVEKMASLGKLAATVAHELNNPLAGILTYAKLTRKRISEGKLTPEGAADIAEDMTMVAQEAMRCGNIVRNLLLFSKREVRQYGLHDIGHIVNHCLRLVEHHLELNEIELETEFPEKELLTVCDRDQLRQAILALLMNAIEAMTDGGVLSVAAVHLNEEIEITLKDTGCGIVAERLPHIFEPFYSSKSEGTGVGLGLSVAYGIIEAHKGDIGVDSTPGVGSTFTVRIPRRLEEGKKDDRSSIGEPLT